MELSEKHIAASSVKIGMYVSRLDRPWSETGFPLQGLLVKNQKDIDQLIQCCNTVYIDQAKCKNLAASQQHATDKKPKPNARIVNPATAPNYINPEIWLRRHCVERYKVTADFNTELKQITPLLDVVENQIHQLYQRVSQHKSLQIEPIVESTADLIESVIRNPDALSWICQLMQTKKPVVMHMFRSAVWAGIVGRQFGLNRFSMVHLGMAQMMTGIGKSALSDESLKSHNVHQHDEKYRQHLSETLYQLEQEHFSCMDITNTIKHYCERHDGSGYPNKIKGAKIPFLSRLCGLIDTFEYLVHPFNQHGIAPAQAISRINKMKGNLFDPPLVEKFVRAVGIYPTGSLVEINNGNIAIVVANCYEKRIQSSVIPLIHTNGTPYHQFKIIDLNNEPEPGKTPLMIKRGLPDQAVPHAIIEQAHKFIFMPKKGRFAKFL